MVLFLFVYGIFLKHLFHLIDPESVTQFNGRHLQPRNFLYSVSQLQYHKIKQELVLLNYFTYSYSTVQEMDCIYRKGIFIFFVY
jgi:hypothetical protein